MEGAAHLARLPRVVHPKRVATRLPSQLLATRKPDTTRDPSPKAVPTCGERSQWFAPSANASSLDTGCTTTSSTRLTRASACTRVVSFVMRVATTALCPLTDCQRPETSRTLPTEVAHLDFAVASRSSAAMATRSTRTSRASTCSSVARLSAARPRALLLVLGRLPKHSHLLRQRSHAAAAPTSRPALSTVG